jgi:hypothetical protein
MSSSSKPSKQAKKSKRQKKAPKKKKSSKTAKAKAKAPTVEEPTASLDGQEVVEVLPKASSFSSPDKNLDPENEETETDPSSDESDESDDDKPKPKRAKVTKVFPTPEQEAASARVYLNHLLERYDLHRNPEAKGSRLFLAASIKWAVQKRKDAEQATLASTAKGGRGRDMKVDLSKATELNLVQFRMGDLIEACRETIAALKRDMEDTPVQETTIQASTVAKSPADSQAAYLKSWRDWTRDFKSIRGVEAVVNNKGAQEKIPLGSILDRATENRAAYGLNDDAEPANAQALAQHKQALRQLVAARPADRLLVNNLLDSISYPEEGETPAEGLSWTALVQTIKTRSASVLSEFAEFQGLLNHFLEASDAKDPSLFLRYMATAVGQMDKDLSADNVFSALLLHQTPTALRNAVLQGLFDAKKFMTSWTFDEIANSIREKSSSLITSVPKPPKGQSLKDAIRVRNQFQAGKRESVVLPYKPNPKKGGDAKRHTNGGGWDKHKKSNKRKHRDHEGSDRQGEDKRRRREGPGRGGHHKQRSYGERKREEQRGCSQEHRKRKRKREHGTSSHSLTPPTSHFRQAKLESKRADGARTYTIAEITVMAEASEMSASLHRFAQCESLGALALSRNKQKNVDHTFDKKGNSQHYNIYNSNQIANIGINSTIPPTHSGTISAHLVQEAAGHAVQSTPPVRSKRRADRLPAVARSRDRNRADLQHKHEQFIINKEKPATLPTIPVALGAHRTYAKVDTHSAISCIDVSLARELKMEILPSSRVLDLAGICTARNIGVVHTRLTVGASTHRVELDVLDWGSQKTKLLLGMDTLPHYGIGLTGLPLDFPPGLPEDPSDIAHGVLKEPPAQFMQGSAYYDMQTDQERNGRAYADAVRFSEEDRIPSEDVQNIMDAIKDNISENESIPSGTFCNNRYATVYLDIPEGTQPIFRPQYTPAYRRIADMNRQIQDWIEEGVVEESDRRKPEWNSAILGTKKKDENGSWTKTRTCFDARGINAVIPTYDDSYTTIESVFRAVEGARVISLVDLRQAYLQLPVFEEHRRRLAFTWNNQKLQFKGAPFGIKHLSQVLHAALSDILFPECADFCRVYYDDLCIYSKNAEEHASHLKTVLSLLTQANIRISPTKCRFGYSKLAILGHLVSGEGRQPDPAKLCTLWDYPPPQTKQQMSAFLGFVGFLKDYVPNLSSLTYPLSQWRKVYTSKKSSKKRKKEPITWSDDMRTAFVAIKRILSSSPVLSAPDWDKPFIVATDASKYGLGAILYQMDANGKRKYISFASRVLNSAQTRYGAHKRELLGVVFALQKFSDWLWGRRFTLYCDHESLVHWNTQKHLNKNHTAWLDTLLEYDMEVVYLKGVLNHLPDSLSRLYPSWVWHGVGVADPATLDTPVPVTMIEVDETAHSKRKESVRSVPPGEREAIIKRFHAFGHYGAIQTAKQIRKAGLNWDGMDAEVKKVLTLCDQCLRYNIHRKGFHPMQNVNAQFPFHHVAYDFGEPRKGQCTARGNNFLLVVVDVCTRYVVLRALPDRSSTTLAWTLWEMFADYGIPYVTQSDNAKEFCSKLMGKVATICGIDQRFVLPYNPASNGVAESQVKRAKQLIFKKLNEVQSHIDKYGDDVDWDILLPGIQMALNSGIAKVHGSAPFDLLFARPNNAFSEFVHSKTGRPLTAAAMRKRNKAMLDIVFPAMHERTKRHQRSYSDRVDAKRRMADFRVGTLVMKQVMTRGKKRKADPRYEGPFRITKIKEGRAYLVGTEDGSVPLTRGVPFHQLAWVAPPKEEDLAHVDRQDDGTPSYNAESVSNAHIDLDGKVRYLVKWENFSHKDSTYEPYKSFLTKQGRQLVTKYWESLGLSKTAGEQALRKEHKAKSGGQSKRKRPRR